MANLKQKEAVVEAVKGMLPNFVPYKDIALVMLSKAQLEAIKVSIGNNILCGVIEYGKDVTNRAEVIPYARSMVMNHLKKAKELNGNQVYGGAPAAERVHKKAEDKALSGFNMDIMPQEMKDFVKMLV